MSKYAVTGKRMLIYWSLQIVNFQYFEIHSRLFAAEA